MDYPPTTTPPTPGVPGCTPLCCWIYASKMQLQLLPSHFEHLLKEHLAQLATQECRCLDHNLFASFVPRPTCSWKD